MDCVVAIGTYCGGRNEHLAEVTNNPALLGYYRDEVAILSYEPIPGWTSCDSAGPASCTCLEAAN